MGTTLSILLSLFVHFMHPTHATVTAQTQITTDEVTPTDMPSVTPTDMPTVTPTDTPTPTPSVTPSVTPTVTPSTTSGDGDKDDMLGLKANVHALFGLMNAAFHHEQNEQRFETKHNVSEETNGDEGR